MNQTIQSELAKARKANLDKQLIDAYKELDIICEQKFGIALPFLIDCITEMEVAGHETNENLEQS